MESERELLLPLVEEEDICLPLPVNAVSKYWSITIPMSEAVANSVRYPGFAGRILIEGIELAERHGLSCKIIHSDVSELEKIIDAGIPPIVILPGIPEITHHASVITGYDDKAVFHYVQKGTKEGQQQEGAIPRDIFDREWSEDARMLIALAPQDVIASVYGHDQELDANRLCLESERQSILKDHTAAISSLKKALDLDPANITAMQTLGAVLNELNSAECVNFYEKCTNINKRCYLAYNGLGNYYLKSSQFEIAESFYTKAIEINPKRSARIYKNRAYLREKQHKNSQAKDDLKRYLTLAPAAKDRGIIEQAICEL